MSAGHQHDVPLWSSILCCCGRGMGLRQHDQLRSRCFNQNRSNINPFSLASYCCQYWSIFWKGFYEFTTCWDWAFLKFLISLHVSWMQDFRCCGCWIGWKFFTPTTWIGLSYFFVLDPYKPSICHWVLRGVDLTLKLSTKMENDYPKVLFNCRKTTLKHHWIGTTSEDGDTVDKSGRCHGVSTGWRKSNYDYYYLYCSNWYRDWELFEGFAAECILNENILCHWWSETLGHQKSLSQAATESVLRWSEILKLFVHVLLFLYFTLRIMSMHEIG